MKIKAKDLSKVRLAILATQDFKCPLCRQPLHESSTKKKPTVDHDHRTGYIRGVLCVNCNGMEGKIWNLARRSAGKDNDPRLWLQRLIEYLEKHRSPRWGDHTRLGLIYPTFKTKNEKRLIVLAKAKRRRDANKLLKG